MTNALFNDNRLKLGVFGLHVLISVVFSLSSLLIFAVRHSYYEGAESMATINAHTSKTGQTTYRARVQKKG